MATYDEIFQEFARQVIDYPTQCFSSDRMKEQKQEQKKRNDHFLSKDGLIRIFFVKSIFNFVIIPTINWTDFNAYRASLLLVK